MKPRRTTFNPKRKLRSSKDTENERLYLATLAERVRYGGNPEHKRNPGDFGLDPPSNPRLDKPLCDSVDIVSLRAAMELLREGVRRGLISDRELGEWPKNIWAVSDDGIPLEAQIENAGQGTYHGYPMPNTDPFRDKILERWQRS
ncbi:MAG: hypothetical protein HQL82_10025 [Magnetococcales bacterium]|nr:hypothetical protein [Magnetococcales bacterium]